MRMLILALRRKENKKGEKVPDQRSEERKKKVPNQRSGENKEKTKFLIKRSEENKRNMQKDLWTRQYLNNTEKEGNHDLKWSSPFDCQPKSYVLATFSPRTKQKQKRKKAKKRRNEITAKGS